MTFVIQVHDWLIRVVWVGINQSRTRIVNDIINSENCYVIYLLRIIDMKNKFTFDFMIGKVPPKSSHFFSAISNVFFIWLLVVII